MAPRIRLQELARLLDRRAEPIYAVDEQGQLVFVNQAVSQWTGWDAADLIGLQCKFTSDASLSGAAAIAGRLCPPPEAMAGAETVAFVSIASPDGELVSKRLRFIPLKTEDAAVALLALGGEPAPVMQADDDASQLHNKIQQLRHRFGQRYHVDRLLGDSPAIERVRAQVAVAAASTAHVLIVGPPGSGREHVARTIHTDSEPLIPLSCSLIGGELLRSTIAELLRRSPGTSTPRATLLLNDLDQLPAVDQADLPSLLEAVMGKLRVISTARMPLVQAARNGEFLTRPAHVLSTLTIELPPLADRLGDLPLLAHLFLEQANARGGKQVSRFTEDALDLLAAYPWTRDLDELAEVVREAWSNASGPLIASADLPDVVRHAQHAAAYAAKAVETIDLEKYLASIELELIQRALAAAKGNKTKAAAMLGLNRPRFYRRLVQLGLAEPADDEDASEN